MLASQTWWLDIPVNENFLKIIDKLNNKLKILAILKLYLEVWADADDQSGRLSAVDDVCDAPFAASEGLLQTFPNVDTHDASGISAVALADRRVRCQHLLVKVLALRHVRPHLKDGSVRGAHQAPFGLNKIVAAKHEDLKFRISESRALK